MNIEFTVIVTGVYH